ncbi:hypothetical protein D3C81_176870 [compost metagenome]
MLNRFLYWLFRRRLTFMLMGKALDAQYPSLLVMVKGNPEKHHVVALTNGHVIFLLPTHTLVKEPRKKLLAFTYAEYLDLQERIKNWQTSEPYKKILRGISKVQAMAAQRETVNVRLRLPGKDGEYSCTAYFLNAQSFMRGIMQCTHTLWMVVYAEVLTSNAYLPHEVKILAPSKA